jgi:hypothetical protein
MCSARHKQTNAIVQTQIARKYSRHFEADSILGYWVVQRLHSTVSQKAIIFMLVVVRSPPICPRVKSETTERTSTKCSIGRGWIYNRTCEENVQCWPIWVECNPELKCGRNNYF